MAALVLYNMMHKRLQLGRDLVQQHQLFHHGLKRFKNEDEIEATGEFRACLKAQLS